MRITLLLIVLTAIFISCDSGEKDKKKMNYSYSCLDSALGGSSVNKTLDKAGKIFRDLTVDEKSITDDVQNKYGEAFHKDVVANKTFTLIDDAAINNDLKATMNDLLQQMDNPSKINYMIYAISDTVVNAFTFGGRIYVTTGMYKKCGGKTPLLYSIIGHEIGHSELGHIKKVIHELMVADRIFGENAETVLQVTKLLTGSFNQRNELEADYFGTDLTNSLNQDICSAVTFWKEMARLENQYNRFEDFFRTHPFSSLRAQCLERHIRENFSIECSGK